MNISKLMPLSFRRETLDINFAHKAREGTMGQAIQNMCITVPNRPNLRWNADPTRLQQGFAHTETFYHFFTNRLPPIWNSLQPYIRGLPYLQNSTKFKNAVKKHYYIKMNGFSRENSCSWVTKCRCAQCRPN